MLSCLARKRIALPDRLQSCSEIGALFIDWLHNVRHRGLFTSMAEDFSAFIELISSNSLSEDDQASLLDLRRRWLKVSDNSCNQRPVLTVSQSELGLIASEEIATNRRSAALPFCINALVKKNNQLFDIAHCELSRLIGSTTVEGAVKCHAMNIIREIMMDTNNTGMAAPKMVDTMKLAVDRFIEAE